MEMFRVVASIKCTSYDEQTECCGRNVEPQKVHINAFILLLCTYLYLPNNNNEKSSQRNANTARWL